MFISRMLRAAAIAIGLAALAGCQTTSLSPVTAEQAAPLYTGSWGGHFINRQGTRYDVTLDLTGDAGQVTGKADIPSSTFDKAPSVNGTYSGNTTKLTSSSGFTYDLVMSVAEDGAYWLTGNVGGPNDGRLELKRK